MSIFELEDYLILDEGSEVLKNNLKIIAIGVGIMVMEIVILVKEDLINITFK